MSAKTSPDNFVYFQLAPSAGGTFHFSTYKTLDGKMHGVVDEVDPQGNTKYKRFRLNVTEPLQIHKDNVDDLEHLTNHPSNPESPWFNGKKVFYRLQPELQAQNEVDFIKEQNRAITVAAELEGKRLLEVASLCGFRYAENEELQASRAVLKFAQSDYIKFMDIIRIPAREASTRRIAKEAIFNNVIYKENGVFKFGGQTLGDTEDSVVAFLTADKDVALLIERRVGLREDVHPKKKEVVKEEEEEASDAAKAIMEAAKKPAGRPKAS